MEFLPIAAFWALTLLALLGDGKSLVYLLFSALSFGSFAVIPPGLTGGLTFTPAPMVSLILAARILLTPTGFAFLYQTAFDLRRLLLLMLYWVVAVIVTLLAPRLFAGQVEVIEVRSTILLLGSVPLQPTTQNLSQLAYMTISIITVFAFACVLKRPGWWTAILQGLLLGGVVAIVTGLLDMAGQASPIGAALAPFRTASYALLTDVEILGAKRVVGLMPEASAYGGLCISLIAALHFLGRLTPNALMRDTIRPLVVLGLIVMAALSTSSAAYVALGVFAGVAGLEWVWRLLTAGSGRTDLRRLWREGAFGIAAVMALALVIMANPGVLSPAVEMVDRMVFQKTTTSSFKERTMWTAVSWRALWDTYGFGVGLGGTRASNAFVAVASNTGVLGAALFYGFLAWLFLRPLPDSPDLARGAMAAARWAFLPGFTVGLMVGTSANFGALAALYFAILAVAAPSASRVERELRPRRLIRNPGRAIAFSRRP
jgi:hypothetical protein